MHNTKTRAHTALRACVLACLRARVCVRACVHACVRLRAYAQLPRKALVFKEKQPRELVFTTGRTSTPGTTTVVRRPHAPPQARVCVCVSVYVCVYVCVRE